MAQREFGNLIVKVQSYIQSIDLELDKNCLDLTINIELKRQTAFYYSD